MTQDILILDYLPVFKDTCNHYIDKFSKKFNIDLSNYKINYGTINNLDGYRSVCMHNPNNEYEKSFGINILFCFMQTSDPDADIAKYEKVSDFIKDLALHEVCHLFNHLVNHDKPIIENRGHDKWFKELYEPLRSQYTKTPFKTEIIDGIEYNNFSKSELPTKEQFESYEKVRSEGKYNMFMEAEDAAKEAGLSLLDYANVMNHYVELMEMYPEVRKVNFAAKSTTEIKKEILESVGLTEKDMSSIKSFKSKSDGYVAIVDCNKVPGFKKGEDSQFKLIRQEKDSHSEKGFETLKEAQDAEKIKEVD